jgi:DNA repair photolyase
MLDVSTRPRRRFQLVLIKPSHYDDDGYVIQWARAFIPSNSLAVVYSITRNSARRAVLGPHVDFDFTVIDEANTRINIAKIRSLFADHDGFGLIALVGVQSNQFPRALDIARPLRADGVPVIIGGFHVSGCLAMLPDMQADVQIALDMGVSLFAGELEGRMDGLLQSAATGTLRPIYNHMKDLPSLEGEPTPILPEKLVRRTIESFASFDAGRGCPYQCSFCTIINVQGRKSRGRTADDVEKTIREHLSHNVRNFFITDDNFARNKDWEPIFDRLIELRESEKLNIRLMIQVDTLCHKIPNFIEKARRAGVNRVFIGLENINPANLLAAKKRQNKITEYRKMLLAWKKAGVVTYGGYILGFAADTPESIRADIEIIKRELPIDFLEFFVLTPLPGSEDHKTLWQKRVPMDSDMNQYDSEHAVTDHPRMTRQAWEDIYREAWNAYYTPDHMVTILRRGAATNSPISGLPGHLTFFANFVRLEKVHPLQGGLWRRKYRSDRRPGFPIEPIWSFYPKYAWESISKCSVLVRSWLQLDATVRRIRKDPTRHLYTDQALADVTDDQTQSLELFTHSDDARHAVNHARKIARLTGATAGTIAHADG